MKQHDDTQSQAGLSSEEEVNAQEQDDSSSDDHETVEVYREKAEEYLDGWKRAKADLLNFQRRTEERQQEQRTTIQVGMIFSVLPLYESFCAALTHLPSVDPLPAWVEGLQHVKKQWDEWFASFGVTRIIAEGQQFDVEKHEAVGRKKTGTSPTGTILEVAQEGYMLHGKVFRPSKVVVEE